MFPPTRVLISSLPRFTLPIKYVIVRQRSLTLSASHCLTNIVILLGSLCPPEIFSKPLENSYLELIIKILYLVSIYVGNKNILLFKIKLTRFLQRRSWLDIATFYLSVSSNVSFDRSRLKGIFFSICKWIHLEERAIRFLRGRIYLWILYLYLTFILK